MSSLNHLDALLLVTHPAWCKPFLDTSAYSAYKSSLASINELVDFPDQPINWKFCRDHLERLNGISVDRSSTSQVISAAEALSAVKQGLPGGVHEAVRFALSALRAVEIARRDLASANIVQRQIIETFDLQHRAFELAT